MIGLLCKKEGEEIDLMVFEFIFFLTFLLPKTLQLISLKLNKI
jgi:hypothetical protein